MLTKIERCESIKRAGLKPGSQETVEVVTRWSSQINVKLINGLPENMGASICDPSPARRLNHSRSVELEH